MMIVVALVLEPITGPLVFLERAPVTGPIATSIIETTKDRIENILGITNYSLFLFCTRDFLF